MDSERWARIQALFHAAADLPEWERQEYLAGTCRDDPSLVAITLSLLHEDARGDSVLDRGLAHSAHQVIDQPDRLTPSSQRFGPYRITKLIGEGGMGVVYMAERDDLGSIAAIKILRDAWLSPARRERFEAERRTLAQLNHPFIAHLYDADALPDGTPWFVMEYVDGVAITEHCRRKGLSIAERLQLFRDVCIAVEHAHRHLVVHRDLKPSNILVTADGTVKLVDFGIAKQLDSLDVPMDQTRTGQRLMTPAYAAPEQLQNGRIGVHTDVYALGVILYELLAGTPPFDFADRTPGEIERILVEQEPTRPSIAAGHSALSRAQWADLDVLCLSAMHKDPARRYRTVEALGRDIDHYIAEEPLEARPDSRRYRVGKFVRRNARAVVATSGVIIALITLVAFYTSRLARARNEAIAETERARRIQRFTLALFSGGDDAAGPADSLRVVTLVDRGLREAETLRPEPAVEADLDVTLGGIYQKLGNLKRADSLLSAALTIRRRIRGAEHPDVAASLVALGRVRVDEAQFESADRLIQDGLDMSRRTLSAGDPAIIDAAGARGYVLEERGKYPEAIVALGDVLRMKREAHAQPQELALSLSTLADAHFYAGHYAESDSLNREALAIDRKVYGNRHPLVSDLIINLGATQFERGNYADAERLDREALAITTDFYGTQHYKTAGNLTMLGRALVRQNRFSEADSVLRLALAIRERVYGPNHPNVASTVNELSSIAMQQGRFDDAVNGFRRMLSIYHAVYGDKHYLLGLATSNMASSLMAKKDYVGAEPLFRDAIRRYLETQGPEHLNTGIARIKLGRTLLRQRRFAEAEVETHAGYDIMMKQASPSISFIKNARIDLVAEYDSLGHPDKAAPFRAALADTIKK
ncbi:MAG: tetratricopeptide repeat protein [bacterium]